MTELLQRAIDACIKQHFDTVERACRLMRSLGDRGTVIVQDDGITRFKLSRHMPYGMVLEFPSMDAHSKWIENGRPLDINQPIETKES